MKNIFKEFPLVHHPEKKLLLLVILGLAIHLILPQITSLEHSWRVLQSLLLWAVGLAFVSQVISYLGSGYLLKKYLHLVHQHVSLARSTLIVLGSASVGMVAGGIVGGSVAIYNWVSRGDGHPERATMASLLPSLMNTIALVVCSVFGLTHLIFIHDLSKAQLISFFSILLFLVFVFSLVIVTLRYRDRTTTVIVWIASRLARLRRKQYKSSDTQDSMRDLFSVWDALRTGGWRDLALGAAITVLFDMLTLFFLFVAAGHNVSPGVLLAGYGLPLLLGKMAFVVPGGVGVVEGSMAALYDTLGVPDQVTVVVVLGYRLISFWFPSLSGFAAVAYLQRSKPEISP
ncbi:MAG: flippase-like domain-containing protein [Anaerolineae bacterium]|nr:flippase-like domain-containing protein [Anaerolineae bacterium]